MMIMKRFSTYVALALCMCFGSAYAGAADRPFTYLASTLDSIGELQASAMTRMELTLAMWQSGDQTGSDSVKANMRSESNHFVMVSAVPVGVPDWDLSASA